MNAFSHSFRHYFRRFRIEVISFWIASGALSVSIWRDADVEVTSRLGLAEYLLLAVVIFRVIAAESLFRTTAGWGLRPVSRGELVRARWALLAVAIVPALVLRGVIWQMTVHPRMGDWRDAIWNDLLPLLAVIAVMAFVIRSVRLMKAREASGLWMLVIAPVIVGAGFSWISAMPGKGRASYVVSGAPALPRGVVEMMRESDHPIGAVASSLGYEPELMARLDVRDGVHRAGKITIKVGDVARTGNALGLTLTLCSAELLPRKDSFAFVIRYGDGSFAAPGFLEGKSGRTRLPFYGRHDLEMKTVYPTPLSLPWSPVNGSNLLENAELIVFRMTDEPFEPKRQNFDPDHLRLVDTMLEVAHLEPSGNRVSKGFIPTDQIPRFLKWPTWSDSAWENVVRPALERHRVGHLKWDLYSRLKTDQRLAKVMVSEGLQELVVPEFSKRLAEGRPLDADALSLLLLDKDFSFGPEALNAYLQLPGWKEPQRVASQRGLFHEFDRMAEENWKRSGAAAGNYPATTALASLAAGRGDPDALRFLARKDDVFLLKRWLGPDVADPARWLAEHEKSLRFDPVKRMFTADGGQ